MPPLKNIVGQRFGRLTVIERAENRGHHLYYRCKCDCGTEKEISGDSLRKGTSQSCGCVSRELTSKRSRGEDITGQRFGRWTVLYEAEPKLKNGFASRMFHCRCDCGTEKDVNYTSLRKGGTQSCGCLRAEVASQTCFIDLTGQRFGRWTVLYRVQCSREDNTGHQTFWHCKCDCGKEKDVNSHLLRYGKSQSCGCLAFELTSKRLTKDLTNQRFHMLKVLYRSPNKDSTACAIWHCKCDCGNECDVASYYLLNGQYSCGCMRQSKQEKVFDELLFNLDYEYQTQVKYDDLTGVSDGRLSYDFLLKYNGEDVCFIECQGQQHYRPVDIFGGEEQFEVQQLHDELKREYAFEELHVPLIEIPYTATENDIREMLEPGGSIWEFIDCYKRSN